MLSTLRDFARMMRVPLGDAEEAMRSDRAAKVVLSRRQLFLASGAMAAGSAFSFAAPELEVIEYEVPNLGGSEFTGPPGVTGSATLDAPTDEQKAALKLLPLFAIMAVLPWIRIHNEQIYNGQGGQ